jgi:competence protein ComEC
VLPPRPLALLALAVVLAFLALERAPLRRAAFALAGLLLLPWSAAPAGLELWALDVGHGTAVVARAPGLEALVFDAGSRDRRGLVSEALVPLLARWDVARLHVALSHGHRDHAGGLERLAQRFPLAGLQGAAPAQSSVRLAHGAERTDVELGRVELPSPCPELRLTLVRGSGEPGNEGSRALLLRWREASVVLLGDAELEGLEWLAARPRPPVRLLLAPHHGSDAPGLALLLDRAPPAETWVSGSAEPAIGKELDRRGLPWRWAARDGPLALRLP